jgi:hypothetical protein
MSAESRRRGSRSGRGAGRNSGGTRQPDLWQTHVAPLAEGIRTQRLIHGSRGFAVVYHGPAAEASVKGTVDGYHGRDSRWRQYATVAQREAYEYAYGGYFPRIDDTVTPKRPLTNVAIHRAPGHIGTVLARDVELVLIDWDGIDTPCKDGLGVDWVYAVDVEQVP